MDDEIVIHVERDEDESEVAEAVEELAETVDGAVEELTEQVEELTEQVEELSDDNSESVEVVETPAPDYSAELAELRGRIETLEAATVAEALDESETEDVEFASEPLAEPAEREPDETPEKSHWWTRPFSEWRKK